MTDPNQTGAPARATFREVLALREFQAFSEKRAPQFQGR